MVLVCPGYVMLEYWLLSLDKYSACYSATKVGCSLVRTAALLLWPMLGTLRSAQAQQWLY